MEDSEVNLFRFRVYLIGFNVGLADLHLILRQPIFHETGRRLESAIGRDVADQLCLSQSLLDCQEPGDGSISGRTTTPKSAARQR